MAVNVMLMLFLSLVNDRAYSLSDSVSIRVFVFEGAYDVFSNIAHQLNKLAYLYCIVFLCYEASFLFRK